jgi:hypothetical protein
MSIYRLQNGKMVEMRHVIEGWPLKIQQERDEMYDRAARSNGLTELGLTLKRSEVVLEILM